MIRGLKAGVWLAGVLAVALAPARGAEAPAAPTAADLDKAVAAMRKVSLADFDTDEKRKAKTEQVDAAWKALIAAGPAGSSRLKQEVAAIDAAKERDDYFKLGAAGVLWQIGGPAEAGAVAGIWTSAVDLDYHYWYVFSTAMDAARSQDERVLPMLTAALRDRKGTLFVAQHYLTVKWPLTHEFLWGAFGSKGLPTLARLIDESKDETTRISAALLAAKAHYLPALAKVRALAPTGQGEVRRVVAGVLAEYGHPADFEWLVAGLASKDPAEAKDFVWALYEYGDLRAAASLAPLLKSPDGALRGEVIGCLGHLLTPESLAALKQHSVSAGDESERDVCGKIVAEVLKMIDLAWDAYAAKPAEEKARLLASVRDRAEKRYRPMPDDRPFTHEDLLKAAAEWQANGRITGGTYAWVEDRHVLAAATPADIPLLVDVKAKCYLRVSDECLMETDTLDGLIRRLGRSRYRKVVGVCEKVEPPDAGGK